MRIILSVLALFGLWLLMSGIYKPMIVWLGLGSSIIAVYFGYRMDKVDGGKLKLAINQVKFVGYLAWLMWEIAKSNIAVTRLILSPKLSLRQHIFRVPHTQKTELAQVVFANSITLTPGTITVETEGQGFWVHAVNFDESDHAAIADMDARVSATETRSA